MLLFTFIKHSNSSDYELLNKAKSALNRGDCNTAIELSAELAEKGMSEAEHQIGYMFYYGKCLKKDINEAVKWYQLGVKKNNPASLFAMGNKYRLGQVVQKDLRKAVELYQKAADLNFPNAQLNLGLMHFNGMGTAKNIELAHKWITKAANQGFKRASDFLNKYQSEFSFNHVSKDFTLRSRNLNSPYPFC